MNKITIDTRENLLKHFNPTGLGIEIGVNTGTFAKEILSSCPNLKLLMLDCWKEASGEIHEDPVNVNNHVQLCKINETIKNTSAHYERARLIKGFSGEFSSLFKEQTFDFIYIDADHSYDAVKKDLHNWYSKLKPGGLFSGHDYVNNDNCGVKQAVDEFAGALNIEVNYTTNDWPSWFFIKPACTKIYDCFLYNGEDKMLNFRLHELNSYVDKFFIVEGAYTFKGDAKPLKFNIDNYKQFADKIVYKSCHIAPLSDAWSNETNQRNYINECFKEIEVTRHDVVLLSDVDEIPDLNFLKQIKEEGFYGIKTSLHNFYYYNIASRKKGKWPGTVFANVELFQQQLNFNFDQLRNARHSFSLVGKHDDYNSGGWHFSYFGDVNYIINKIKSFSHQEYNNEKYTNPEVIKELIKNKKDLFFREESSEEFDSIVETYLPTYINLLD